MGLADLTPVLELVADVGHHSLALVVEPHSAVAVPLLTVRQCRAKVCVEDTLALRNVSLSTGANTTITSSSPISNFFIKVKRIKRRRGKEEARENQGYSTYEFFYQQVISSKIKE